MTAAPARLPRWPGGTVFVLGGGPSLDRVPLALLTGEAVIAVNDAVWAAPFAAVCHFGDARWGRWHRDALAGLPGGLCLTTVSREPLPARPPHRFRWSGREGLAGEVGRLRGRSSGHQAINLAVQLGAARIVLLGFDHRVVDGRTHHRWTRPRPVATPASAWDPWIVEARSLPPALPPGVEIVNATPGSAIDAFPIVDPAEVLPCAAPFS